MSKGHFGQHQPADPSLEPVPDKNTPAAAVNEPAPPTDQFGRTADTLANGEDFVIEWADQKRTVRARDSIEAWAIFCESLKQSPSPKGGKANGKKIGYESSEKPAGK